MSVNYRAIIGLGYVISEAVKEKLELHPDFDKIEDNIFCLDGWRNDPEKIRGDCFECIRCCVDPGWLGRRTDIDCRLREYAT
jgi:hypothetical protein